MTRFLYDFHWDCGRQGDVEGRLLATPEDIESIVGKEIYFGEILGKHSEIHGTIELTDFKLVTDNVDFLKMAEELKINLESGHNQLFHKNQGFGV